MDTGNILKEIIGSREFIENEIVEEDLSLDDWETVMRKYVFRVITMGDEKIYVVKSEIRDNPFDNMFALETGMRMADPTVREWIYYYDGKCSVTVYGPANYGVVIQLDEEMTLESLEDKIKAGLPPKMHSKISL